MAGTVLNDNAAELQEEITEVLLPANQKMTSGALRQAYADSMRREPFSDAGRADEILASDTGQPIFVDKTFHAEDMPEHREILQLVMDVTMDIATLDNSIVNTADRYATLIAGTIGRLNAVKERLARAKQRQEDIRFVSNAYEGVSSVITLTGKDMTGSFGCYNNTFMAAPASMRQVRFSVQGVSGNGYAGNDYVVDGNGAFVKDTDDRSNLSYISDDSLLTTFEYSRLCSRSTGGSYSDSSLPSDEEEVGEVNHDNKDATCVLEFTTGEDAVNLLAIDAASNDLQIADGEVSVDGRTYHSALTNTVDLSQDMYHAMNYVPGSNMVCFPASTHIRLVLTSGHVNADEKLAGSAVKVIGGKPVTTVCPMNHVARKVIAVNGIRLYACSFTESVMHTHELCPPGGCSRVAIFANQFLPDGAERDTDGKPVSYILRVNGKAYPVVPINSHEPGTKMIADADASYQGSSVAFIDEKIRSIQLGIAIKPYAGSQTPFLGNVKVCIG